MAEFIAVITLITSTACVTVMVLDWRSRVGEVKARIDFKAEILKAGALLSESNTNIASSIQKLSDRLSALEMKNIAGKK